MEQSTLVLAYHLVGLLTVLILVRGEDRRAWIGDPLWQLIGLTWLLVLSWPLIWLLGIAMFLTQDASHAFRPVRREKKEDEL